MPIHVGILGATGTVGTRFVQLLENHPQFIVSVVGASSRSVGKIYSQVATWKFSNDIPNATASLTVVPCIPNQFKSCMVIFSALDSDVAEEIELDFVKSGFFVFSNAKNHRMNDLVPLCVPLANPDHLDIIPWQKKQLGVEGFLVTNANCSTTGLVVVLKALESKFGPIDRVMVTTMQAISGAGYPGVSSMDIIDNVVPYIEGEEQKLETEPLKILGQLKDSKQFVSNSMKISASCNRVNVIDGHLEIVSVSFIRDDKPTLDDISKALQEYQTGLKTHSSPKQTIIVKTQKDRPQPRLDRDNGHGQSVGLMYLFNKVTVGGIRNCGVLDVKMNILLHNTILGAAGSSILNAEIALEKGYLSKS